MLTCEDDFDDWLDAETIQEEMRSLAAVEEGTSTRPLTSILVPDTLSATAENDEAVAGR